jgi:alpha-1,3-glucan synthase
MQGVGFGMILLQTLTRFHICFVLLAAQVFGSLATICARAFAPNNIGPGDISPNIGVGVDTVWVAWFWIALFFQLIISYVYPASEIAIEILSNQLCSAGFFLFFRREQLTKP